MNDASLAEQLRVLRLEATAAIAQRQALAVEARAALIAAMESRLICRPGCEDALAVWGLEPLPEQWTVCADALLSYTRAHADDREAGEQAPFGVPDEVRALDPVVALYPRQVVDVTRLPDRDDQPAVRRYRVTVQVRVQTWATATREAAAHAAARAAMQQHLSTLAAADITLTDLTWHPLDSPDDAPADDTGIDTRSTDGTAPPGDDLAAATAARDAALDALASLVRRIRARAIQALVYDEFGGSQQRIAQRVDGFLTGLGLDALPRVHHVLVVVQLMLTVDAGTAGQACETVRKTMRAVITDGPDEHRPWTGYGWTSAEQASFDQGRWQVPWRHEYEMRLRDQATSADAAATAEALVHASLDGPLAGVSHQLIAVSATVETVVIDPYLDPDRD
ncbi:hypothetical protein QQG74_21590 [Micromonospora sp. FIMYZ51]|uniref:hypothetical protein n=1 Tax=Micromonospora sp. FIMYZ51 TaxID=3051832 RepID=UPI00311DE4F7